MNIDGICLSVIDQMIFQVEQKSITDESIKVISLEDDDSVQAEMPTYNLHQFNDLYPHYPLTPARHITVPRIPGEADYDLTFQQNSTTKLDKLVEYSEKLILNSGNIMERLNNLEKILLSNQQAVLTSRDMDINNNIPLVFSSSLPNETPFSAIENISGEVQSRRVEIRTTNVQLKREVESEYENKENVPIANKKIKLRVGLSKRRTRQ